MQIDKRHAADKGGDHSHGPFWPGRVHHFPCPPQFHLADIICQDCLSRPRTSFGVAAAWLAAILRIAQRFTRGRAQTRKHDASTHLLGFRGSPLLAIESKRGLEYAVQSSSAARV